MSDIQNAINFLEELDAVHEVYSDIMQIRRNRGVIEKAAYSLTSQTESNEQDVDKCILEMDENYGDLIRVGNSFFSKGEISWELIYWPNSSYKDKTEYLMKLTNFIPIYVCLRENWDGALKQAFKQLFLKDIDDTDIMRAKEKTT